MRRKQGQGPWARISTPGVLGAWSRMEAVGSGCALPHSPTNASFCRERCEPCYVQGPGHRPLWRSEGGATHTSVLAPNSRFFSTTEWPAHYLGFGFILLKARKQIWVTLSTWALHS